MKRKYGRPEVPRPTNAPRIFETPSCLCLAVASRLGWVCTIRKFPKGKIFGDMEESWRTRTYKCLNSPFPITTKRDQREGLGKV